MTSDIEYMNKQSNQQFINNIYIMVENKIYETPQCEVINLELQGVIALSGPDDLGTGSY